MRSGLVRGKILPQQSVRTATQRRDQCLVEAGRIEDVLADIEQVRLRVRTDPSWSRKAHDKMRNLRDEAQQLTSWLTTTEAVRLGLEEDRRNQEQRATQLASRRNVDDAAYAAFWE